MKREPRELRSVAEALGPLRDRVVFIGGAIAPLLQDMPPFTEPRPTSDVDAIISTRSYGDAHTVEEELASRGFRRPVEDPRHAHRWIAPDGTPFDLVPTGEQLSAIGGGWDRVAVDTAEEVELGPGVRIRRASAPAFLALKWAAYEDRGREDPFGSHDLEDVLALLASRPASILEELGAASPAVRAYLAQQARALLDHPLRGDLLAGHLNNALDREETIQRVARLLEAIAG